MTQDRAEEKQLWVTCLFTDILLSYMEEAVEGERALDYPGLFSGIEGLEAPSDPEVFLKDVDNWVPLAILRELLSQCEEISGEKDIAHHAARAYFDPGKKKHLPSLFEMIVRVLNDVRSVLICSNLWAAVQTNYLKLQSFEKQATGPGLYMLAQFDESARPSVGGMHLLRGICEGFPRLYPFIKDVESIAEVSQLWIEDIIGEFPDFTLIRNGPRLSIVPRHAKEPTVEAIKVPLKSEEIPLSQEFLLHMPDAVIAPVKECRISVLTNLEETEPRSLPQSVWAYRIVSPGTVSHGTLSYTFRKGEIYNAPYSRFRFVWKEKGRQESRATAEDLRREVSQLLFDHLKQIKETQTRAIQYNIEKRRLILENTQLKSELVREYSFSGMIGQSDRMQQLFRLVRSIAETDITVLIQGETGTGKELIARAIHYHSPRRAKRFVAMNCGALSETLLESELFGHERGAFTGAIAQRKGVFEAADGGTLFLDEIGETTPSTQVKLLRVLQEGELQRVGGTETLKVDVRVIAATNQNLEELVKKGRFRQDLFYRLNVFPILVSPLRERAEDIPLLASHCVEKRKQSVNQRIRGVSPQAMTCLMAYSWPGNVRELENVIQRMMVVAKGELLDVEDLPPEIRGGTEQRSQPRGLKDMARESAGMIEKRAILDALSKTGKNVTQAAKLLGVSRATLQNKIKLYGLRGAKK